TAFHADAAQARDFRQVDEMLRPGQAQLHRRDQGVTAGQQLGFLLLGQQARGLPHRCRPVLGECVHCDRSYAASRVLLAFCNACHTVWAVAGIAKSSLPIASVMALMTATGAAIAPASPQPLMPSGFDGDAVLVMSTLSTGRLWARGMQ